MKCVVCKSTLVSKAVCEPFSMNSVIGQECPTILSYLVCPKCGLMYQKTQKEAKKEKKREKPQEFSDPSFDIEKEIKRHNEVFPFRKTYPSENLVKILKEGVKTQKEIMATKDDFSPVSDFTHQGSGGF